MLVLLAWEAVDQGSSLLHQPTPCSEHGCHDNPVAIAQRTTAAICAPSEGTIVWDISYTLLVRLHDLVVMSCSYSPSQCQRTGRVRRGSW